MIIPPSHNAISERLRADDAELSFRTPNNKNFLNNVLVARLRSVFHVFIHPLHHFRHDVHHRFPCGVAVTFVGQHNKFRRASGAGNGLV